MEIKLSNSCFCSKENQVAFFTAFNKSPHKLDGAIEIFQFLKE